MWRPPNWEIDKLIRTAPQLCDTKGNIYNAEANKLIFEAGADAIYKAIEELRPSNDEIKAKLIACLYGGSDVPELLDWLKEKLLVRGD